MTNFDSLAKGDFGRNSRLYEFLATATSFNISTLANRIAADNESKAQMSVWNLKRLSNDSNVG